MGVRFSTAELRSFRVERLAAPDADASGLRGPCLANHPLTMKNTVRIGRAGYRCRICRRTTSSESLKRVSSKSLPED